MVSNMEELKKNMSDITAVETRNVFPSVDSTDQTLVTIPEEGYLSGQGSVSERARKFTESVVSGIKNTKTHVIISDKEAYAFNAVKSAMEGVDMSSLRGQYYMQEYMKQLCDIHNNASVSDIGAADFKQDWGSWTVSRGKIVTTKPAELSDSKFGTVFDNETIIFDPETQAVSDLYVDSPNRDSFVVMRESSQKEVDALQTADTITPELLQGYVDAHNAWCEEASVLDPWALDGSKIVKEHDPESVIFDSDGIETLAKHYSFGINGVQLSLQEGFVDDITAADSSLKERIAAVEAEKDTMTSELRAAYQNDAADKGALNNSLQDFKSSMNEDMRAIIANEKEDGFVNIKNVVDDAIDTTRENMAEFRANIAQAELGIPGNETTHADRDIGCEGAESHIALNISPNHYGHDDIEMM